MEALLRWQHTLSRVLEENVRQQIRRRSRSRALERFAQLHPRWYESTFDEWFIGRLPPGLLEARDATALAREWTRQFRYRDERRRESDIRRLTPVAESFLNLLESAEAEVDSRLGVVRVRPWTALAQQSQAGVFPADFMMHQ
jgi:hypothetical protein